MTDLQVATAGNTASSRRKLDSVVVRFAGDSGDGIQVTGGQFTLATALAGNDLATFPDYPAEIRAPVGTTFGVSAFQIHFGDRSVKTAGDAPDTLIAFNPAALKVNLPRLPKGGLLIVDEGSFNERNFKKAEITANPLEDGSLDDYNLIRIDITKRTLEAVKPYGLSQKEGVRCKNFWALGLVYWLYDRDPAPTEEWLKAKFRNNPKIAEANIAAMHAGHAYGETMELDGFGAYTVPPAPIAPGQYRTVTGAEAMAWGLVVAAGLADKEMMFASYPITPASVILHHLARLSDYRVTTFQAEDEIAAVCAAIGASYAGSIGVTSSSGPGIALKGEALGLAVAVELPLVVVNSQRAGPSTGMPTKTEQADLFQAVFGRNGDAPMAVLAVRSPGDAFDVAVEATRIALTYMTPVMILTDGYINNAAEPWKIPDVRNMVAIDAPYHTQAEGFHPFARDPETLARPWAIPGTPGLAHRIGGIERDALTGNISYDPANHQKMTDLRAAKIRGIANSYGPLEMAAGKPGAALTVVGWGSTYGAVNEAVQDLIGEGADIAHVHLRHIWPLHPDLGDVLRRAGRVVVPEMNNGQLLTLLRSEYLIDARPLDQVTGQPFRIGDLKAAFRRHLEA